VRRLIIPALIGVSLSTTACAGPAATGPGSPSAEATGGLPGPPSSGAGQGSPRPSPSIGVPEGFPSMPGSVAVDPLPDEPGLVARWTIDTNGAEVYRYFTESLPGAGFTIVQLFPGGAVAIIRLETPTGEILDLSLTGDLDSTRISLKAPDPPN
jgi:hypothetical protein